MTDDLTARRSAKAKVQQAEIDRKIIARAAHIPSREPVVIDDPTEPTTPEQRQALIEFFRMRLPVAIGGHVSAVSFSLPDNGLGELARAREGLLADQVELDPQAKRALYDDLWSLYTTENP